MALVDAGMPCALCRSPIDDPMRDTFAMTMWGIEDDRFAMLDDAACHQACIDQWEHRDAFLAYYNRNCRDELYVESKWPRHLPIRLRSLGRQCVRHDICDPLLRSTSGTARTQLAYAGRTVHCICVSVCGPVWIRGPMHDNLVIPDLAKPMA